MEKMLYWFLRIFGIIVASGAAILLGLGLFTMLAPGGIAISVICYTVGAALIGAVKVMFTYVQKLKEKL